MDVVMEFFFAAPSKNHIGKPETMLRPCMASYHNPHGAAGGEPYQQKYAPLSGGLFRACQVFLLRAACHCDCQAEACPT